MKYTQTSSEIARIHEVIAKELKARSDPVSAKKQAAYLKGTVRFYGLKAPALRALLKGKSSLWKEWDDASLVELSWRLLSSEFFEEKDWGISLLRKLKTLDDMWLRTMEERFSFLVNNWAVCDGLCGAVFRPMLTRDDLRRRILSWKDSSSLWLQRAAAVAFVNEAKRGLYNEDILAVCRTTIRNPDRFVQLGTGWVLRELSLADRPLVNAFIQEHRVFFINEGLRYALEKHPADERLLFLPQR